MTWQQGHMTWQQGHVAAGSRDVAAGSRDVAAGSRDVAAGSRDVAAGSRDVAAGSRDVAAGSRDVAAGSRDVAAGSRDMAAGSHDMETGPATGSCDIEGEGKDHEPVAEISVVGFTSEELQSVASLHMSLYNRGSCVSDGSVIARSAKFSSDLASSLAWSIDADAVPGKFGVLCFQAASCKVYVNCTPYNRNKGVF